MLAAIEQLLVLQDHDLRIAQLQAELGTFHAQKQSLQARAQSASASRASLKETLLHLESQLKQFQLDVQSRQELIERYSMQQFQTRKNDEYRTLAHEIQTCQGEIAKLVDQQLEVMIRVEALQQEAAEAARQADAVSQEAEKQSADLEQREARLRQLLADSLRSREAAASAAVGEVLLRYERLRKSKGERVVVGVEHGACGGCHMKLPAQVVVTCRGAQEVPACPNCGRILYYTPDMDLAVAE